ncbi:type II inositol-1-4-5-trisphosphate 5-phosphatase [Apiospora rasikravindrae]|uniref:Type II inositol-1-4-5-trisphosphate 5-phosphatase n=1 Tax=Apiospora rasikravindrae TaxID=990691 RepID=A0ABR1SFS1_9PEZI
MTASDGASTSPQSEPVDVEQDLANGTTHYSLSRALLARKNEYVRRHRIRVKVGSWNVAACPGTDKDLAGWFVDGRGLDKAMTKLDLHDQGGKSAKEQDASETPETSGSSQTGEDDSVRLVGGAEVGLYVLGLQEIIALNSISQYADTSATSKWQAALEAAMPPYYKLVTSQQLSGLLLLMYASPEVADTITNVSTVSVGTGLLGYMGNKGGVSSRIMLGETTRMVFTNCHLASGHDQANLDRRCWDYGRIMAQTQFAPLNHGGILEDEGEKLGDEDFGFWFGDLNYRLDGLPGDDIRRLLMLHTRGEYDLSKKNTKPKLDGEDGVIIMQSDDDRRNSSDTPAMMRETSFDELDDDDGTTDLPDPDDFLPDPHDDPASVQATIDSLLPHDQLSRTIKARKAFHEGWREGAITFLPSYKYDVGTVGLFDSSEKRRAPSWCDRILYRTRKDIDQHHQKLIDEVEAKKKDEDMKQRGIDHAADDESVLFDYDPAKDAATETSSTKIYDYDEYDEDDDAPEGGDAETVVTKDGYKDQIKLDVYTTHQRVTSSDHKPIVALFTLDYDAVVPELKAKVHAEVAKELDRVENEGRPGVTIVVEKGAADEQDVTDGSGGIHFGDINFLDYKERSLTVANTGRVSASFCFVAKLGISGEATGESHGASPPEWLHIDIQPSSMVKMVNGEKTVTLEPGETVSAVIDLSVTDLSHLHQLNGGIASLEDVLVLRVENGKDHFIPIHANWLPSTFGRSIDELIRVPSRSGGLRGFVKKLQDEGQSDISQSGSRIPQSSDVHTSSPPELFKLTEAIETLTERCVADENMLQEENVKIPRDTAGWPFTAQFPEPPSAGAYDEQSAEDQRSLAALIKALDTDNPTQLLDALPPSLPALKRLELTAQVFVLFLRSLSDGIISGPLFSQIEAALPFLSPATMAKPGKDVEDDKTAILDILATAPYHNISFVFITAIISRVASEIVPLTREELAALDSDNLRMKRASSVRGLGVLRRTTSSAGRAPSGSIEGVDERNVQRRLAWEKKVAEILATAICRHGTESGATLTEKQRKASEERMRGLVQIFMRRRDSA